MRHFITTTALTLALAGTAFADSHATDTNVEVEAEDSAAPVLPADGETADVEADVEAKTETDIATQTDTEIETDTAEVTSTSVDTDVESAAMATSMILTSGIVGGNILSISASYDEESWMDLENDVYGETSVRDTAEDIGGISDLVLNSSGQMVGIVAEVGGFLGLGDKSVMLPLEDVRLVQIDEDSYSYVTRLNEEQLEALPEVEEMMGE